MSTAAIPVHVALVDESGKVAKDLSALAAALSEQIQADFAPVWKIKASVGAYSKTNVPEGCWAVHIQKKLDDPNALGYHTDENNQPVAYVELTADYAVTVSHEVLEMLADPWGNRVHRAILPRIEASYKDFGLAHEHSYVSYLLEVCDPCEATSYKVGGVDLSDFLHPSWYRTSPAIAPTYSQAGGCVSPREVADGGYVSFGVPASGEWFQVFNENGQLQVSDIGKFNWAKHGSLREFADAKAREHRLKK